MVTNGASLHCSLCFLHTVNTGIISGLCHRSIARGTIFQRPFAGTRTLTPIRKGSSSFHSHLPQGRAVSKPLQGSLAFPTFPTSEKPNPRVTKSNQRSLRQVAQPQTQCLPHVHRPPPGVRAAAFEGVGGPLLLGLPLGSLAFRLPGCPTRQEGGPAPTDTSQ